MFSSNIIKMISSSNLNYSVLLISLVLLTNVETFAQSQIILDTTKNSFSAGDIVELTGKVEDKPNQPVAIEVQDPDGNTILIRTVMTDAEGNFVLKFKVPPSGKTGSYNIVANANIDGTTVTQTKEVSLETQSTTSGKTNQCLIATAAFGSELAPQVQMLREIRDNVVLQTNSGTTFMIAFNQVYYSFAPTVAEWERQNSVFKEIVKAAITPLITTLSILNYVDADSEAEVLFYGISLILLNVGLYFVAPAFVLIKLNSKISKKGQNSSDSLIA